MRKISTTSTPIKARQIARLAAMSLATTIFLNTHSAQAQVVQTAITNHPLFIAVKVLLQMCIVVFTALGIIGTILGLVRYWQYYLRDKPISKLSGIAPGLLGAASSLTTFFLAWNLEHIGLISPFVATSIWLWVAAANLGVFLHALFFLI